MAKASWVKANVTFLRRGPEDDKPGYNLRRENWQFGNKPIELYQLIIFFARAAIEFSFGSLREMTGCEVNEQLQKAALILATSRFGTKPLPEEGE